MHEMSIVMRLADIAMDYARRNNAKRISRVVVQVGELTGAVPRYLSMFYPAVAEGTLLEGSELVVETIAASVFCTDCGSTYNPTRTPEMKCPECGGESCDTIEGKSMFVKEIAIEEGDAS
ncbi:MAG TPA: hydrogenase maturation nickel metallochaperone HypA [Feifaniaceae bacterium]|nr:hydrogenase maturation nickel metallochaperone HypA [Feifaniaceae bacterium]